MTVPSSTPASKAWRAERHDRGRNECELDGKRIRFASLRAPNLPPHHGSLANSGISRGTYTGRGLDRNLALPGHGDASRLRLAALTVLLVLSPGCGAAITRLVTRKMREEWLARGVPAEITCTYSIRPDGLHIESQVAATLIRWPFINEIMLVDGRWLLFSAVCGIEIWRTFFRSGAEERAFLLALFCYLVPLAQARSHKAEKVISQLPGGNWRGCDGAEVGAAGG